MLIVFGDSHAHIWGGSVVSALQGTPAFPAVKVNYLGPALAYNLMSDESLLGKWGAEIIRHPDVSSENTSAIMLSFGEIDCRTQVVKRAARKKISIREVCSQIAERYLAFVDELRKVTDVPIILWGPIATTPAAQNWDENFPNVGSEVERNSATRELSTLLQQGSERSAGVYFISVFDKMVTPVLTTMQKYIDDGCHLDFEGLGLAIEAFNDAKSSFPDPSIDYFEVGLLKLDTPPGPGDIANQAKIVGLSSNAQDVSHVSIMRRLDGDIFHTKVDDQPWVIVDIGFGALLDRLEIFRSIADSSGAVLSLEVFGGINKKEFDLIYRHDGREFGANGAPLAFYNSNPDAPIRFLMFRLQKSGAFRLSGIKLYAQTFLA